MQLNDLRPAVGSRKNRKRVGRGNSSGNGTFAGRGMNGQLSRSGGGKGAGFEGGQQPLAMRLPSFLVSLTTTVLSTLQSTVARLNALFADGETVDAEALVAKGVIKYNFIPVKVLGDGELSKKLTVKVDKVSASAKAKIEAAGGKVEAE